MGWEEGEDIPSHPKEMFVPAGDRPSQRAGPWRGSLTQYPWALRFIWNWQLASLRGFGPHTGSVCSWSLW